MSNEIEDRKTRREREKDRLLQLGARRPATDDGFSFSGVLLSDAIEKCCNSFGLITPFNPSNLKPANYKLTIGDEYAIAGKIYPLSEEPGKNAIRIEPFEVAVIKTFETINMPRFLIGRWNIQVSKAYKGLLWVGGPQVDAGYVGHLFCPIYNLSDQPVILHHNEPFAVIDFEKTTELTPDSKDYGELPERILFEDYEPESLQSALATRAENTLKDFRHRLESLQSRIDTFVTITVGLLGILFAAGAVFATRFGKGPHWWNPGVFWICAIAIFLSASAWVSSRRSSSALPRKLEIVVWLALFLLLGAGLFWTSRLQREVDSLRVRQTSSEINQPSRRTTTTHPKLP